MFGPCGSTPKSTIRAAATQFYGHHRSYKTYPASQERSLRSPFGVALIVLILFRRLPFGSTGEASPELVQASIPATTASEIVVAAVGLFC